MMLEEFVQITHRVSMTQFNFGMAMIQAAPGPNFNLAVYMNTMAMNNFNGAWQLQILASIIGLISVFLPGLLLVFFAYPVWSKLQYTRIIQKTTPGLFAASIGFILSATLAISQDWISQFQMLTSRQITFQIIVFIAALIMQSSGKVQTPLVVLFGLIVGWLMPL
jgi:chromate transporter